MVPAAWGRDRGWLVKAECERHTKADLKGENSGKASVERPPIAMSAGRQALGSWGKEEYPKRASMDRGRTVQIKRAPPSKGSQLSTLSDVPQLD